MLAAGLNGEANVFQHREVGEELRELERAAEAVIVAEIPVAEPPLLISVE